MHSLKKGRGKWTREKADVPAAQERGTTRRIIAVVVIDMVNFIRAGWRWRRWGVALVEIRLVNRRVRGRGWIRIGFVR